MEVNKLAHRLMSEYVKLDPWDAMFKEVNQAVNTDHGRITLHIFWELHYDFLPNFCYNSTTDRQVHPSLLFSLHALEWFSLLTSFESIA